MTLIVDTAPLVSLADRRDPRLRDVSRVLHDEPGDLVIPAPVTAEIDYFLSTRYGDEASRRFMVDLAGGAYRVECLDPAEYHALLRLRDQYADLNPGLADLALVILAARFDTVRVLTFDHRHFRAMRPLQGGSFVLLPADV